MKRSMITLLAVMALAGSVEAASRSGVNELADRTGLSERQVRMLAGAPTAFAEYRTSYRELARRAAVRGLDLRALSTIERHRRALDRAVATAMRYEARRPLRTWLAGN